MFWTYWSLVKYSCDKNWNAQRQANEWKADILIFVSSSGRYTVNVKYGDKHVPNSPFRVRAGPPFDASKVKVSGPGVDESPLTDVPVQFVADCTEAGIAPLTGMDTSW